MVARCKRACGANHVARLTGFFVQDSEFHLKRRELAFLASLAGLILVTVLVYWPGLTGPFVLDDFANLSPMGNGDGVKDWPSLLQFVFGNTSGPLGRPLSMLSFLIDGQDWPPNIASFKYTNILIHALNGVLLCWFGLMLAGHLQLTQRQQTLFALVLSGFWLLHPLNSTTTLYVVQRMTQVMTLFSLSALICYLKARARLNNQDSMPVGLLVGTLFPLGFLAVLAKENGALLLALIVAFECTLFSNQPRPRAFRIWFWLGVVTPLCVVIGYLFLSLPEFLPRYEFREFSVTERLLTEARILCSYLYKIIFPNALGAGIYHDDYPVSTGLLSPASTLPAVLFLVGLFASALRLRQRQPMFSLAVFWFLAMHFLESSFIPLELYFEHRNYLAMIGPLAAGAYYLITFLGRDITAFSRRLVQGIVAVVFGIMVWLCYQQALLWSNTGNLMNYWAFEKPGSLRAQIALADFAAANGEPGIAMERLQQALEIRPREVTVMLHMWNHQCEYGVAAPYSLAQIAAMNDLEYFHNDINFHLQTLLENRLSGVCDYPEGQVLVNLFERLARLPLSATRASNFHYLYSDLYVMYGELDAALINLSRAHELNARGAEIPLRQAVLSASAGRFQDALVFLDRAREADASRAIFMPSQVLQIDELQQDFSRLANSAGN